MKHATARILATLSERGYRVTKARARIVEALARVSMPLTIQELALRVRADEASVYRTVALLKEEGLIEEVVVQGGRSHFALFDGHHHHAVCTACDAIEHIPCHHERISIPSNFLKLHTHEVTYYGLCRKCG